MVGVVQLDQHAICVVSSKLGANGGGCLVYRSIQGSLLILSMDSLFQGFSRNRPEGIVGTNLDKRLLVPVEQCQTWIAPKWRTKSDTGAAVVPVLHVSRQSVLV